MALKTKPIIDIDFRGFFHSAKRHLGKDWPKAVVGVFEDLAQEAADDVRARTAQEYDIHSDYILRGIRHTPNTAAQRNAAMNSIRRYSDMTAAVYLRGSSNPRRSLEFMAHHEQGERRRPQGETLAMPTRALKEKSFRTAKGRVRKRWKPETLLQRYKEAGSVYSGRTTTNKGKALGPRRRRMPGKAFLIRTSGGDQAIVRRKTRVKDKKAKHLEFLYILKKKATIKDDWGFSRTVKSSVTRNLTGIARKHLNTLPSYK